MILGPETFPGEKVFEDFREIDFFFWLRQFSRPKKSLTISGILMIRGLEVFAGEKSSNNYGIKVFFG